MENKELIKKLSNLKSIAPDKEWKERNRGILFSQISAAVVPAAEETGAMIKIFVLPRTLVRFFSTPAWAVFFVCLLFAAGSVFSVRAARLSKPDSSLYIARIISEKAQLAVTFGEEKKAKLSFRFANDHAKDITEILANTDLNNEGSKAKADKLSENFKNEIKVAKTKLKEIKGSGQAVSPDKSIGEKAEEVEVFSANLGREEKGMQLSEPGTNNINNSKETAANGVPPEAAPNPPAEKATNTPPAVKEEGSYANNLGDADKILEEAEKLFNEKDYSGTLNKLEKADTIVENINSSDKGEVKGVSEGATTTTEK